MKLKLWTVCMMTALLASSWPSTAAVDDGDDGLPETLTPSVLTVDAGTGRVQYDDQDGLLVDVRVVGVASSSSGFDLLDPFGRVVFGNQSSTFAGVVEFWYQVLLPGTYTVTGPEGTVLVTFDASPYSEPGVAGPSYQAPPAACRLNLDGVRGIEFSSAQTCDDDGGGVEPCDDCIDTDPCPEGGYNCLINDPCEGGCTEIRECSGSDVGVELNEDKHYCYNTNLCPTGVYNCVPLPCQGTNEQSCADYLCNGICNAEVDYCDTGTGVEPACLVPCPSGSTGYQVGAVKVLCVDPENCETGTGVPPACLTPCPSGSTGYMVGSFKQTCVGPYQVTGCGAGYTGYTVNGQRYCIENAEPCNQAEHQWGVEGSCHEVTWCGTAGYNVDGRPLVCVEQCDAGSGVEPVCQDTKPCTGQNYQWGVGDCYTITWCGEAGYYVDGQPLVCVQKCATGSGVEPVCQEIQPCEGSYTYGADSECHRVVWCGDLNHVGISIDGRPVVCEEVNPCLGTYHQWGVVGDCHTITWCGDADEVVGYSIDGQAPVCLEKDVPCTAPSPGDCVTDYICSGEVCQQLVYCTNEGSDCAGQLHNEAPAPPDADSAPDAPSPDDPDADCSASGSYTEKTDEKVVWTPIGSVHSPYGGTATASGGWSTTTAYYRLGYGKSETVGGGFKLVADGGRTSSQWQLMHWAYYETTYYTCGGISEGPKYARILDKSPHGTEERISRFLEGASRTTDADDLEVTSGVSTYDNKNYGSLALRHRYTSDDARVDTRNSQPAVWIVVTKQTFESISLGIAFNGRWVTIGLELSGNRASDWYYEYYIPSNRLMYVDYLGKGAGGGAAFCSADFTACAT